MEQNNLKRKQVEAIHKAFRRGIQQCLSNNDGIKENYLKWMVMYHWNNKSKQLDVLSWFDKQTMKCSPKIYKIMVDIYKAILLFDIKNVNAISNVQRSYIERIARFYEKCLNE